MNTSTHRHLGTGKTVTVKVDSGTVRRESASEELRRLLRERPNRNSNVYDVARRLGLVTYYELGRKNRRG